MKTLLDVFYLNVGHFPEWLRREACLRYNVQPLLLYVCDILVFTRPFHPQPISWGSWNLRELIVR